MLFRAFLSLLVLLGLCACAEQDPAQPDGRPALWVIRTEGRTAGWLFGTLHALPGDTAWRYPALDAAIAASDVLLVEVADLDDAAAIDTLFRQLAFDRPPGTPVSLRIDPALRGEYAALTRASAADRSRLDQMESWAAALSLANLARSGESWSGADRQLIADYDGRPILELEGAASQLALFDRLPEGEQRDLLNAVLLEAGSARNDPDRLLTAWLAGDLARLEALTTEGMLADPELRKVLLIDRNCAWAGRIVQQLRSGTRPFIAVGAGHMLGPHGLPALLAAQGYEVRRVP